MQIIPLFRLSVSERVVPAVAGAAVGRAHVRRRLLHRLLPHRGQLLSAAGKEVPEKQSVSQSQLEGLIRYMRLRELATSSIRDSRSLLYKFLVVLYVED